MQTGTNERPDALLMVFSIQFT